MNSKDTPPEFTEAQIRTGLRMNIISAGFGMVWFVIQGFPLTMLLEALGATGVMIGMIAMLNQVAMLIQVPAALLADKLTHRKRFWFITVVVARLIWLMPAVLVFLWKDSPRAIIFSTLAVVGFSALLIQSSAASWWSWMADLIPDSMRSRFWNIRQGICTATTLIGLGLAGWFLDLFPEGDLTGFGLLLLVGAICGMLEGVIHLRVPEPAASPAPVGISLTERLIRPLRDPNFRIFTFVMCIWFFGLGLTAPFAMVFLKQTFGALYRNLSLIQMAGMAGSIVTSFYAGSLIRHTGIRTFGMVMLLLAPLFHVVWFFINPAEFAFTLPLAGTLHLPWYVFVMICSSLMAGSVYAAVTIYQMNMLTTIVPREGRTTSMAVHWFLIGLASTSAPVIGGWIKDHMALHPIELPLPYGTEFDYIHVLILLHVALIWLAALPLTRKLTAIETDMTIVQALAHIFITHPLRIAREASVFYEGSLLSLDKTKERLKQSAKTAKETARKVMRNSNG